MSLGKPELRLPDVTMRSREIDNMACRSAQARASSFVTVIARERASSHPWYASRPVTAQRE